MYFQNTKWNDSMETRWSSSDPQLSYSERASVFRNYYFLNWSASARRPWLLILKGVLLELLPCASSFWLILAQSAWQITGLLLASTQLFYLWDAHQGLCQQYGTDSAIRDLGAGWREVLSWERIDLGFSLGFLPICSDYCQVKSLGLSFLDC